MPALATLEELRSVLSSLEQHKGQFPEAYGAFGELLKKHRKVGYKNICKLLLGETTPEKLKGEQ
jgi:hypothetical protein